MVKTLGGKKKKLWLGKDEKVWGIKKGVKWKKIYTKSETEGNKDHSLMALDKSY